MRRLFAAANTVALVGLVATAILGGLHGRQHVALGLCTVVLAFFSHCLAMASFMGIAKLLREHVGRFDLDLRFIDRLNEIFHPQLAAVLLASCSLLAAAILGAVGVPAWLHAALGFTATIIHVAAAVRIHRLQGSLSRLIDDVAALVPATQIPGRPAAGKAIPGFTPDVVDWTRPDTRARFLLAVGVSLPLAAAWYELVGTRTLGCLWIPVALVACGLGLAGALVHGRR